MDAGAAYLYVRRGSAWSEQAKLTASDAEEDNNFGSGVAIDADVALVGAEWTDDQGTRAGSAYVFERSSQGDWIEVAKLLAPDGKQYDAFGSTVALADGSAFVASDSLSVGAVYVFERTDSGWEFRQKVIPWDFPIEGRFGSSFDVLGGRLAVGAYGRDGLSTDAGAVYVFESSPSGWQPEDQIVFPVGSGSFRLGRSVALGPDLVLAGAQRAFVPQPGIVFAYVRSPDGWVQLTSFEPSAYPPSQADDHGRDLDYGQGLALIGSARISDTGLVHVMRLPPPSGFARCGCPAGPCGNSDPDAGCASSTGAGALLLALGGTDPDHVSIFARGLPPHARALFVQGDLAAPIPFGDGLSCLGGSPRPVSALVAMAAPDGLVGIGRCFGDPPITSGEPGLPGSGTARGYQVVYRDPSGPCGSGWNVSSAVEIIW